MNERNKKSLENFRAIGKYRVSFFLGMLCGLFSTVIDVLADAFPRGVFIKFKPFLFKTLYYIILGFFVFLFIWHVKEFSVKGRTKHIIYLIIGLFLFIFIFHFVFKIVQYKVF